MNILELFVLLSFLNFWSLIFGFNLTFDDQILSSFDLAPWSNVWASSTCGESGPEKFCYLTDLGFELGHDCDTCDASYTNLSHPASNIIDGSNNWWKSSTGTHKVSITFDFEKEFFVSFVALTMGPSPKPADWVLERSTDFGKSYRPWQFFAERPQDCKRLYGIPANLVPRTPDQVICNSDTFKILKNEEVFVMLIKGRTLPVDISSSPVIQNWTRATNVRLRFFRLQTLGGEMIHSDKSATRRHFYSVRSIAIGGRCMCNGHESGCLFDTKNKEIRCQCADNTCGRTCSECCPSFRQQPWSTIDACKACNCNGHSEECVYNKTVAKLGLSLNTNGKYEGGGVCLGCLHNTSGINCHECQLNYYRVRGLNLNDSAVCQGCSCNPLGSLSEQCHPNGGQCPCRWLVGGLKCDRCVSSTVWNFPYCKPCGCFEVGSLSEECDSVTGQCHCRDGMTGLKCNVCTRKETQILTLSGCLDCDVCGVGLIKDTASTLLPLISESSDFTFGFKSDLDDGFNFVERRLDWLQESMTNLRDILKKLPLSNLKAIEDSEVISRLEGDIIHLYSRWFELEVTSKYMLPLVSAVSFSARKFFEKTENLISNVKATEFRMRSHVGVLVSLRMSCKNNRCLPDYNLESMKLPVARWSNIKKKSFGELNKAKQFRTFIINYLWTTRRIKVSLEKFHNILTQSSEKCFEAKKLLTHLKSGPLQDVRAKISDIKQRQQQLIIPDKYSVSSLQSHLQESHNTIIITSGKLFNLNYERFKDWSRESFDELEEFIINMMWPHVLALEETEQLILKIFRHIESKLFVRRQILDNFVAISQKVANANRSTSFLSSIEWPSNVDYHGSTDGSGVAYDDEDYARDVLYEEEFVFAEETVANFSAFGLEIKNKAQHIGHKLEAFSSAHKERKTELDLVSIVIDRVAKELNIFGREHFFESSLKLTSLDFARKEVSSVAESSIWLKKAMKKKYGEVDLEIKSSRAEFTNTTFAVSNVTLMVGKVFQLVNDLKRFVFKTSRLNDTVDRIRHAVKRFHQLAAWFNTPVTLTTGHLNIQVVEDSFLSPYSLTTRLELTFKPDNSNSFLLLLGNPLATMDMTECFAFVRIIASRIKVTVGQGNQTLELQNTLALTYGHWYHMSINWIRDVVNVSLSPFGNEKFGSIVGGRLPMVLPTVRRFFPATVFIGGYSAPLADKSNISEFRGSLSDLRVNNRPLGLVSKSSVPFTQSTTTAKLDTLSFNGFDFLSIDVALHLPIVVDFYLRTLQRDAVVLLVQFQSKLWFAVTLRGGELSVEFQTQSNGIVFSKQSLLGSGLQCNNGKPHLVQIKLLNTPIASLHLTVDTLYRNSLKLGNIGALSWSALYVGGLPNTIRDDDAYAALCPASNFQGCLMQFRVSNRSLVSTSPLSTSITSCPHDMSTCVCSSERSIQVKRLGFVIHEMAVLFAVFTPIKSSRTVIHYSTSPYTGFKIEVGTDKTNWIEVSFWSKGGDDFRRYSGGSRHSMIDTTWHLVTLSTNSSSSILTVDGEIWKELNVGLVQKRLFTSQQLLFLGPDNGISEGSVCYRDFLLNGRPLDLTPYIVASDATVCNVTF